MLRQIGALLDEQDVPFKPAAYRRAAQVIEELPKDISTYGGVDELKKLPLIGDAIAQKIIEFLETGHMTVLDSLRLQMGDISAELMDIEGVGSKRARQFEQELGIKTVPDLIAAAKAGKLQSLPRMSEDMEKKILEYASRVSERIKRFPRGEIEDDVEKLLTEISAIKHVDKAAVAGSYRRHAPTVGDIDILVTTKKPKGVSDAVASHFLVRDIVAHGEKKVSFNLASGLRVDVRFVAADQWGAALLYFTGSKEHNIAMRKVAIKKGWKLNEYGLFDGEKCIASKTEKEIYAKLGLPYFGPQERTGSLQ